MSRLLKCYAECHYAECRYVECLYAERRYAECHYAECRYVECCSAPLQLVFPAQAYLAVVPTTKENVFRHCRQVPML